MPIVGSIVGFAVFFAAHVVVFRNIQERDAVRWFFLLVVLVSTLIIFAGFGWLTIVLFIMLASCYFMGIFGLMATSVRIRILCEIARAGSRGMTMKQLLARYNREAIVTKRLARLVSSGDIVCANGKYRRPAGRMTFFTFPALLLRAMKMLYG